MLGENFIKAQLCLQAYRDAASDGVDGMLACAFVIRNRVRAGWQGGDWTAILSHHRDYAASNLPPQFDLPDPRNFAFSLLLQQIDGVFSGATEDAITSPNSTLLTTGAIVSFGSTTKPVALYYGRLNDPNLRPWFLDSISRDTENHHMIASVGSLSFFS